MAFWFALGWYLFFTAASFLLRPKPRLGAPQPSSLGDFQMPTATEGRCISYLAGSALVQGPNVLWFGDYDTTPIVQDGQTTGYQYYMGLQYGICMGPVDRVLDLRFDQKVLAVAPVSVTGSLVLVVNVGGTDYPIALPNGEYATGSAVCQAFTPALRDGSGEPRLRVVFGFQIMKDWNDRLTIPHDGDVIEVIMRPGNYTGPTLQAEISARLTTAEVAGLFITFDNDTGIWKMEVPFGLPLTLTAAGSPLLATIGFADYDDITLVAATPIYGAATAVDTFFFVVPPGSTVKWTDAATTAETFFGMTSAGPDFTAPHACASPRPAASEQTTYSDLGDVVRVTINAPTLFQGIAGEGGIAGAIDIYKGTQTQEPDDYLATKFGAPPPAFFGLCYSVARKLYQGNAPYLKNISFAVERCPNLLGLAGNRHRISIGGGALGDDANAACYLHEILTDDRWGMGMPESMLDLASFRHVGETLHAESLGISLLIDSASSALDVINDLLRHIDGVLYADPESGLLTLKLVRADYDYATLPVLDANTVRSVKLARGSWSETKNVVKVQYIDRTANHTQRVQQIQDLAGIQMLGRAEVEEVSFKAISNPAAAQLVGERLLKTVGYPLGRYEIEATRAAYALRPAQPFRLDWPKLGIAGAVLRVTRYQGGEIRNNIIILEALDDVYGLGRGTYSPLD